MAKRILILLGILIVAGAGVAPPELSSCGPFLPQTVFAGKVQPIDEPGFFRGQIGILQPQYRVIYLMAAYRYLSGIGLSKEDRQDLLAKSTQPDYSWDGSASPAVQGWLQARIQVGAPPFAQIDPSPIKRFKTLPGYAAILNCGDDAFRSAAATLTAHAREGESHDELRAWVAAQDQVFANCGDAPASIPAALPDTVPAWMRADRAYQIAAAEFYATQFDAAAADFRRIADDRQSPWRAIAPYLAARALVRKTTIVDESAAAAAQEQLRQVIADPGTAAWHDSARGLSRFLRAHTDPAGVSRELADTVASQKTGVAGAMNDYRLMLAHFYEQNKTAPRDTDIADWIAAMQNTTDDHASARWRTVRSLPWLVAALTYADRPDAELMAAAAQVPESSPAFPSVEFHRLRLLPPDEARPGLDVALRRNMSVPAHNLFLAARMRVARDWSEVLRFAPRTAAATFTDGWQTGYQPVLDRVLDFDDDAAQILNDQVPLALLRQAVDHRALPGNLRLQVARATWVRAVLLGDAATASGVAPVMAALDARLKPYVDAYLAAPDEKLRAFNAAWLLLNNPGMRTSIDAGAGRLSATSKLDRFRDNWWCRLPADRTMNAPLRLLYRGETPRSSFLTEEQRTAAADEQQRLAAAPAAPTWMARQAVEWTEAHPSDPRAPEALALTVQAGHYACGGDADSERWVKRAFGLLHRQYANTAAARKTPYWFEAGRR